METLGPFKEIYRVILGFYPVVFSWGSMGVMEKNMEITI